MSRSTGEVYLSPETEAQRLWDGAEAAFRKARHGFVELSEAVELGVRVVEIACGCCLQALRDEFPGSIASLLEPPPPDVDPERDFVHPPRALRFIDAVDMLLDLELPCISRELHRGWEDRYASCQRTRARAQRATGVSLNEEQRDDLMMVGACRNRIFALPPPVRIIEEELLESFPALEELAEKLFARIPGKLKGTS